MSEEKGSEIANNVSGWFGGIMGEYKKIIWPDRKELVKKTISVILIAGLIGGIIVLMDFILSQGYSAFVSLF